MMCIVAFCLLSLAVSFSEGDQCEAGWIAYRESCYYVNQYQHYSFQNAKKICDSTGANLVEINDEVENLFLEEFVCDDNNLWIGLTDIGHEGHFEWQNDKEATYRNWNSGEPNNHEQSEHCTHLTTNKVGYWNDNKCSAQFGFVCEKEPCHGVPVGVASGTISNSQMTASSNWASNHMAYNGRLNFCQSGYSCSWCAKQNTVGQWLQIDLGGSREVTKVATQGRQDHDQWVTSYKLSYGDGSTWSYVNDKSGQPQTFNANSDRNTVVYHALEDGQRFTARYVRFVVQSWHVHISMRVEVYACR
ncbi:retinoschisin-like [Glandiceps talaboti]